jgi:hypothetical protein
MPFYGARRYAQLPGYFFVAAAQHQQIQNLPISWCNLNFVDLHFSSSRRC